MAEVREFKTGATRDLDVNKYDYEGFLSPLVVERFGKYMHKHRQQMDGKLRDSDNWQKGIPQDAYMKSAFRHFHDWWKQHRGHQGNDTLEESLCALMFNTMGYLHEYLKRQAELSKDKDPDVSVWESEGGSHTIAPDNGPTGPLRDATGFSGADQRSFNERQQRLRQVFRMHETSAGPDGYSGEVDRGPETAEDTAMIKRMGL